MNPRRKAERLFRYLSFVAYKTGLVNAQLKFIVHQGKFGRPILTLKDWKVNGPACTCPNLKEIITQRLNELVQLRHGYGELLVFFRHLKLDAIIVSSRFLPGESDQFGDQLDPDADS
jgi:hypothetical protein